MKKERIQPYKVHYADAHEFDLGRCRECKGKRVSRLGAYVKVRSALYSIQVHSCVECWKVVHRHVERI